MTTGAEIRKRFGLLFKAARLSSSLSRQALSDILGVSLKTIQAWENGRCFIEDLSSLPAIKSAIGLSVGAALDQAAEMKRSTL